MSDALRGSIHLRRMSRALDALALVCKVATGIALVVLTVIFGWLVFGRYVLNATPTWVEQVALLLVMLIAFLGAAVGVHEHTHLSVSIVRSSVPRRVRSALVVISDISMAAFGGLMLWYGWQLTLFKWGSLIPLIQVPEGLRSLPLTVGGALILLFSLGHLIRLFLGADERSDSIE
ncbi:TRAP transporter small permease [Tateyamaria sp. syn59]|uniref:TRAP transporter small permease n=1 Tax=Tateyamaria sp. syn59 TaxID=2576942 RepID=UPI0011BE5383|nr:TRAP transporter small permease [Tateyamaria sp. syn59]